MEGLFRRRHLPHWDMPDATYFVTTCLAGSIPALGMKELRDYRDRLDSRRKPDSSTEKEWEHRKEKMYFGKLDLLLDHRPAVRYLEVPSVATIVRDCLFHFSGSRYELLSYVVMPSHLHWVFRPLPSWCQTLPPKRSPREVIMHSLKTFMSKRCNALLGRIGVFWQGESYDHWVRDDDELDRIVAYVENNPIEALLAERPEDYRFSSAYDRDHCVGQASEPVR